MAFIPVPDSALAVVSYTKGLESFSNTFWFRLPDFTYDDQAELAALMDSAWGSRWKNNAHTACNYVQTTVYDMRSESAPIVVNGDTHGPGVITGEVLPISVALVVSLYSGSRGKTGRGRIYLAGFGETQLQNGIFSTGLASTVMDWIAAWKTLLDATAWQWCICSRYVNGEPRAQGLMRGVMNYTIRTRIPGTQRRRLDRP